MVENKTPWHIILPLCIFFFAALLYANTINHGFVLDDDLVLAKNSHVVNGEVGKIFSSSYHEAFMGKKDQNYRPMSMAAFAIESKMAGKTAEGNPKASFFHTMNVLWYAISCVLLFFFLLKFLDQKTPWFALAVSLLFVAHPIHTEVVANVKSRDEIFVFFGMVATLLCLLKYLDKDNILWLLLSLGAYFFAVLSKESGLAIIALVPLTLFFKKIEFTKLIITSGFYLIPVIVFFLLRMQFIGDNGTEPTAIDNVLFTEGISSLERLMTGIAMFWEYIQLLFFPHPLSYDYSAYQVKIMGFGDWQLWAGLLSFSTLAFFFFKSLLQRHILAFAIGIFGIMFAIVGNILFPIGVTMAERLIFSPSLGFSLAVGYILYEYLYKKDKQTLFWFALAIIAMLYSAKTYTRNQVWKSNKTLHLSGIHSAPNSARANSFYGNRIMEEANATTDINTKNQLYQEALFYFQNATTILPSFRDAHHNTGLALQNLNDQSNAIAAFDQALALDPNYSITLCAKGISYHKAGDNFNALALIQQAYDNNPNNAAIQQNLLFMLQKVRDYYRNAGDIPTAIEYDKRMKAITGEG